VPTSLLDYVNDDRPDYGASRRKKSSRQLCHTSPPYLCASVPDATFSHPLADTDWAVRHVLQYGPDATVLEPAEVREAVVQRLGQMAVS
jgi:predicted DNA-binding transcriptional regulator YafY